MTYQLHSFVVCSRLNVSESKADTMPLKQHAQSWRVALQWHAGYTRESNVCRVVPLLRLRAVCECWRKEWGDSNGGWDTAREKKTEGNEVGARHIERVKKGKGSPLLCQQIRFGFGSPVHRITPNWNRLEGDLKRPHTTRPVHQTDKQNWILYSHILLAVQTVDSEHGAGRGRMWHGEEGWKLKIT
jgi:hypothetical protein